MVQIKRIFICATASVVAVCASAQNYSVLDEVMGDWRKASGMEGPYRFEEAAMTPAPKGYKPFYISHYGRHGSRYAWNSRTYKLIHAVLDDAAANDNLTPYGIDFRARFEGFYKEPLINTGDLVELGVRQHSEIAAQMYRRFPEVFSKGGNVSARSSTSQRCIVSMAAFTTSLGRMCPRLEFSLDASHLGMREIVPPSAPSEVRRSFRGPDYSVYGFENTSAFADRIIDYDGILSRLFKDISIVDRHEGGRTVFFDEYYHLLGGYQNYADTLLFRDAVTPEQLAGMWEAYNYSSYIYDLDSRYGTIPLIQDIISRADDAISGGGHVADLRFGHDYIVEAFSCLLNLNGCGTVVEKADDVKYWFQSYNVPKASTIQIVLYRSRKGGDILFKLLWNGKEAALADLEPVSGPYYRWSDFCNFAERLVAEYPEL